METVVNVIIYVFAALFIALALGLFFAYYRMRHPGTLLMGITYLASAGAALGYMQWWPLVMGLLLTWVIRLMGLEPRTDRDS
jgi:hypothetical protein